MIRALCCAAAVAASLVTTTPALASTTPAGDGQSTPDSITTSHIPLSLYAEKDGPDEVGYLLAGGDHTSSFVAFSQMAFHADGSSSRVDLQATTPAKSLMVGGNLSGATLSATEVEVTRQDCTADFTCTSATTTELVDFTATATGPVTSDAGSQYSRVGDAGKTVVAGASKTRPATITVHIGDLTWTATDDGWATAFVQLAESSYTYVNRGGPF